MEIYCVGGAPRDVLLNNTVRDLDYVVIGATHDEMINQGFSVVGSGFPVYLHPITGDEHALGRTETKTGIGYNGFTTKTENVTLQQDLSRRDLRCNALAVKVEDWNKFVTTKDTSLVIDYFGGVDDLKNELLHHINDDFGLDPVRVLRTARFAARYNFAVDPETIELMRSIAHELDDVPQERIWAEFEKGLVEQYPHKMFETLAACGALKSCGAMDPYNTPDIDSLSRVTHDHDVCVRFALTCTNFKHEDYERCRIPTEVALVGYTFNSFVRRFQTYPDMKNSDRLRVLDRIRAFSRPWLLEKCLDVFKFYARNPAIVDIIKNDVAAAKSVNAAEIAQSCTSGKEIQQKIFDARVAAMQ